LIIDERFLLGELSLRKRWLGVKKKRKEEKKTLGEIASIGPVQIRDFR